jgi:MFS family permease
MKLSRDFLKITFADLVVRSAYQMGKTPLLPIFAAALGASGTFLGVIVSISTLTGLVLKPLIGILSDRWGRRLWLLIGTIFFVAMPFFYRFVYTPEQLFLIRIIHGLATAIYGPVTLAYIAELKPKNIAESLGWFGMARSGGYIVGPALAGWLLLSIPPQDVFTIIGLISCLAILPVLSLKEIEVEKRKNASLFHQIKEAFVAGIHTPAIWLSGSLELITFIALYATKAFLPIFALDIGVSIALVGLFFSLQEGTHILIKPFVGRLADRIGYLEMIASGMILLGIGLVLVPQFKGIGLLLPSILTGAAQAFIFPSSIALVSRQITHENLGASMGFIGMMENLGKVIGPVLGGLLIEQLGFEKVIYILAALLVVSALALAFFTKQSYQYDTDIL